MNRRWLACLLTGALAAMTPVFGAVTPAAAASVINVAPSGSDTAGCGNAATPCKTVTTGYARAAAGDTIRIAAGTYDANTPLVIAKPDLHFVGAKAGVDARGRTPGGSGETVVTTTVNGPTARDLWVAQANGVTIDGFTFEGNAAGAGVSTSEQFSGYRVENTIFSNNLKGFAPSSNGASPSVFTRNLFVDNNNVALSPGHQGNGVFTYRPLANARFEDNKFLGNHNASVNIAGGEVFGGSHDITIADNDMDGEFPVTLVAVSRIVVSGNSMIGGWSGVQVSGACHNVRITDNTIKDKTRGGILLFTGFAAVTNTAITIDHNTIERTGTIPGRYAVEVSRSSGVTIRDNLILHSGHDAVGFTARNQSVASTDASLTENTIRGSGGSAITVAADTYTGPMTVQFNRIVDSGAGHGLVNHAADANIDARWNWWGCNSLPSGTGCDHLTEAPAGQLRAATGFLSFHPWLILSLHSVPTDIPPGAGARINADLQGDSNGGTPTGPFFHPVLTTFTADPGTVTPHQVTTDALLHAHTLWPAGQPRPQSICATVDHQTLCLHYPAVTPSPSTPPPSTSAEPEGGDDAHQPPASHLPASALAKSGTPITTLLTASLGLTALGLLALVGYRRTRRRH